MTNEHANLFAAIVKVMADVRSLPKNGHNKQNSYDYVTSDDALESIGKAMAKHGVVVIPSMTNYETMTDGKMTRAKASFDMHICGTDGAVFTSPWIAEGIDYGNPDKALTKAMTYATKTFLLKLFVVGAGGDDPDGESTVTEKTTEKPTQKPKKATTEETPEQALDKARKHFHASGVDLFGDKWDKARPLVIERYCQNKTPKNLRTSSGDLGVAELDEIAGTFKKSASGWKSWLEETMSAKEPTQQ